MSSENGSYNYDVINQEFAEFAEQFRNCKNPEEFQNRLNSEFPYYLVEPEKRLSPSEINSSNSISCSGASLTFYYWALQYPESRGYPTLVSYYLKGVLHSAVVISPVSIDGLTIEEFIAASKKQRLSQLGISDLEDDENESLPSKNNLTVFDLVLSRRFGKADKSLPLDLWVGLGLEIHTTPNEFIDRIILSYNREESESETEEEQ